MASSAKSAPAAPSPRSSARSSVRSSVRSSAPGAGRRGLLAAVGFAGLFLAGMLVTGVLGTGTMPSPFDAESAVASFFAHNRGPVLVQGVLQALSGVALGLFARTAPNGAARAAGWGAAASLVASGLLTASVPALDADGDTLHTLHYLTFLSGGQIHVPLLGLLVGAVAVARARSGSAPRWLTGLGLFSAAVSVASLVSFATDAAMLLLPLGRFTAILWLLVTAVRARGSE